MLGKVKKIHFVGIGGIGMSGMAELLFNLGYKISGSDLKETNITNHLKDIGINNLISSNAASEYWIRGLKEFKLDEINQTLI